MNEVNEDISIKQKIDLFMENINSEWSVIEKAKYIYINLGKLYSFNNQYVFGDDETKKQILEGAKALTSLDDELVNKRYQTCISLNKIYILLLKQIGINAREIPGKIHHVSSEIEDENGQWYAVDLQKDLPNIQTNSRTKNFAVEISTKKQLQIDEKIGYVNKQRKYTDECIQEFIETNFESLLDFYYFDMEEEFKNSINNFFEMIGGFLNVNATMGEAEPYMGFIEQKLYYMDLFRNILPGTLKMYYVSESKSIMTIQKNDKNYMFFKNKGNAFIQMNEEEIEDAVKFIQAVETRNRIKEGIGNESDRVLSA